MLLVLVVVCVYPFVTHHRHHGIQFLNLPSRAPTGNSNPRFRAGEKIRTPRRNGNRGIPLARLAHPEGELEDLAEHVGFDFLDMSNPAKGRGSQSAGGS